MNRVHFNQLTIHKMPGIANLELRDLCTQVNIVHGPNAAGKSSLARALCAFWSPNKVDTAVQLQASAVLNSKTHNLEISAGKRICRCSGNEIDYPFVDTGSSWAYLLELSDLLIASDEEIAKHVVRQIMGGLDIPAAIKVLEFQKVSTRPAGLKRTLDAADVSVTEKRRQQEGLENEEADIEELEAQLEQIAFADKLLRVVSTAIELSSGAENTRLRLQDLQEYDPKMEKLYGNELDSVDKLNAQLTDENTKLKDAQFNSIQAKTNLQQTQEPAKIDELRVQGHIDRARGAENSLKQLQTELNSSLAEKKIVQQGAGEIPPMDLLACTDLPKLIETANECIEKKQEYDSLQKLIRWVGETEIDEDAVLLQKGIDLLRGWLSASDTAQKPINPVLAGGVMLVAALFAALTAFVGSIYAIGTVKALVVLALIVFRKREAGDRKHYRENYEGTNLEEPSEWSVAEVNQLLQSLERRLAELNLATAKEQRWADKREELQQVRAEFEEIYEELQTQLADSGLNITKNYIDAIWILSELEKFRTYSLRITKLQAEIQEQSLILQKELAELTQLLGEDVQSADMAQRILNRRLEEKRKYQELVSALKTAETQLNHVQSSIEQLEENTEKIYKQVGLEEGDYDTLRSLCTRYDDWKAAQQEYQKAKSVEDSARKRLQDECRPLELRHFLTEPFNLPEDIDSLDSYLSRMPDFELEELKNTLEAEVAKSREITDEIQSIKTSIDNVKANLDLEKAVITRNKARDELRKRRTQALESSIGWLLAQHLRKASSKQHKTLIDDAKAVFEEITFDEYSIELDSDNSVLNGWRKSDDEFLLLEHLSAGTRAQLLIAARIAYIKSLEKEHSLPLVMDESLANSDDERANQIISSLCEVAKQNRQIVYFTAQSDEVGKWERIATDRGIDFKIHSIESRR